MKVEVPRGIWGRTDSSEPVAGTCARKLYYERVGGLFGALQQDRGGGRGVRVNYWGRFTRKKGIKGI